MHDKLAVIGDRDSVLAFSAVGLLVYKAGSAHEAERIIKKIADDCAVIFITEDLAAGLGATLARYREMTYPAIVPIPAASGSSGFGMANIKSNIEKAIGTDIIEEN